MNNKFALLIFMLYACFSLAQGCPSITMPTNNQQNISISTAITWTEIKDATGYFVLIGTTLGGRDLVDRVDVGKSIEYIHDREYPANTVISVKITVRYGDRPDQTCGAITFMTGNATPKNCNHFINSVVDFKACDLNGDSFEEFNIDLIELESRLIVDQTGLNVTYHDPDGSPIDFSIGNQAVVNQRTIMARATDANGCIEETLFNLLLIPPPEIPKLIDVTDCEAYILPILDVNSTYFTESGGNGSALSGGNLVSTSQRIYIYARVGECFDEHSFQVTIDPTICEEEPIEILNVEFPKFFTPNGDGFNDYWQLISIDNEVGIVRIMIFDRFGKLIKQLNQNDLGWDGAFQGKQLPSSDYWFQVNFANGKDFKGHFALKR